MRKPPSKFAKITIVAFIIFVIIGLTSCKTKQKATEREKEKAVSTLQEKGIDKTVNDIKTDSFAKKGSSYIFASDSQSLELMQADPNKKITVEDEKGNKLHITGANAIIKNSKKTATKKDTSAVGFTQTDKSKLHKVSEKNTSDEKVTVTRTANSNVKTTSIWMWFTLGFLLLIIILLVAFRKRLFLS